MTHDHFRTEPEESFAARMYGFLREHANHETLYGFDCYVLGPQQAYPHFLRVFFPDPKHRFYDPDLLNHGIGHIIVEPFGNTGRIHVCRGYENGAWPKANRLLSGTQERSGSDKPPEHDPGTR